MSSINFSGFNDHSRLRNLHAFLSPSKYHWLNYDNKKLIDSFYKFKAAERGVELHEFAATCIRLNQKLPHSQKTLNMYVNDAIGFKMEPELVLYYSENCFGTCDAICFRNDFLRIHDYKSGETPAKIEQLQIYAALFCLEYKIDPYSIGIELRIYQNNEIIYDRPDPMVIRAICDTIVSYSNLINDVKEGKNFGQPDE